MRIHHRLVYLLLLIPCLFLPACARYHGPFPEEQGVTFKLKAPAAQRVSIVGSFNDWDRKEDRLGGPDREGWWSITLPLGPGRHEYLFLVDGRDWLLDPHAVGVTEDGFGGKNAVVTVPSKTGARVGMPDARLRMKIREGQAKNMPAETLQAVAERLQQLDRIAEQIAVKAAAGRETDLDANGARVVRAVSLTLGAGFPAGDVENLADAAAKSRYPLIRFSRLLEAMVNLRDWGMPSDLALQTARQLIRIGASESVIARTERELLYWREKQYSWTDAFYTFHAGTRPGMESPGDVLGTD